MLLFYLLCYAAVLFKFTYCIMLNIMLKNKYCGQTIVLFMYKFPWKIHYI